MLVNIHNKNTKIVESYIIPNYNIIKQRPGFFILSPSSSSCHAASTDLDDSLAIYLYHPSLPVGPLEYILCPYRAVVDRF